ncbi:hypothetical protein BDW72DRAFT_40370 [Aspergillus terricola var. indicus]
MDRHRESKKNGSAYLLLLFWAPRLNCQCQDSAQLLKIFPLQILFRFSLGAVWISLSRHCSIVQYCLTLINFHLVVHFPFFSSLNHSDSRPSPVFQPSKA